MTEQELLEIAERVEAWYDHAGDDYEQVEQFAADIGRLLSHIAQLQARYDESRKIRNSLIQSIAGASA